MARKKTEKTFNQNYNPTLEEDLQEYARTQDPKLFDEKLYKPLRYLALWIYQKYNGKSYMRDHEVDDYISNAMCHLIKFLPNWRPNKGSTAFSWCHMVIRQQHQLMFDKFMKKKNLLLEVIDPHDIDEENKYLDTYSYTKHQEKADQEEQIADRLELKAVVIDYWRKHLKEITKHPKYRYCISILLDMYENNEFEKFGEVQQLLRDKTHFSIPVVARATFIFKHTNMALKPMFLRIHAKNS